MNDEPTFDPRRKAAIREYVVANAAAHPGRAGGRKRTALIATLVLLALTISGGTVAYALGTGLLDPAPLAAPTETVTPAPTATPAPTPTAAATPTPTAPTQSAGDPSTWIIDFGGIGPARLGSPVATTEIPGWTNKTDPSCLPRQRALVAEDDMALVLFAPTDSDDTGTLYLGFNFTIHGDVALPTPRTSQGIGLGSTTGDLLAAYPGIEKIGEYNGVESYYGLSDENGTWIVFGVLDGKVTAVQVGPSKTIPSEFCPA